MCVNLNTLIFSQLEKRTGSIGLSFLLIQGVVDVADVVDVFITLYIFAHETYIYYSIMFIKLLPHLPHLPPIIGQKSQRS